MESSCVENVTCETFTLTVLGTQAAWAGQRVQVQLNWQSSANEYDIYIHQGANTNTSGVGANSGALVTSATRVDRDALLGALFPNGIPARESVIRDLNAWLDQAERLARQG